MPKPASSHPTELELEILKVLWREGPSTVRRVREALALNLLDTADLDDAELARLRERLDGTRKEGRP